jgi:hypothetical protein
MKHYNNGRTLNYGEDLGDQLGYQHAMMDGEIITVLNQEGVPYMELWCDLTGQFHRTPIFSMGLIIEVLKDIRGLLKDLSENPTYIINDPLNPISESGCGTETEGNDG